MKFQISIAPKNLDIKKATFFTIITQYSLAFLQQEICVKHFAKIRYLSYL